HEGTVDYPPYGAARVVEDQLDHGVGERVSVELLGGHQELTGEPGPLRIRGERRRHGEGKEDRNEPAHGDKEHLMEHAGLVTKAFFKIGERMFGQVPTPERLMAEHPLADLEKRFGHKTRMFRSEEHTSELQSLT